MSEAPADALVLTELCPLCEEETITCWFWSERLSEGGVEGQGEEERTCKCPADEFGFMQLPDGHVTLVTDICAARYDQYVSEETTQREIEHYITDYASLEFIQRLRFLIKNRIQDLKGKVTTK